MFMSAVERPGISERWLKSVKKPGKQTSPYGANQVATYVADLNYFVVHGRSEKHLAAKEITGHEFEPTNPPQQGWEAYLPVDLHVYGAIRFCEFEATGINSARWDNALASAAFGAVRLSQVMDLHTQMLLPRRFPGKLLRIMNKKSLVYTALGLVNGDDDSALSLARMQLAALRTNCYAPDQPFPMSCFTARLLADYLGQAPLLIKSDPAHLLKSDIPADAVMDGLFSVWSDADPESLRPHLLAACDIHTHQAYLGANSYRREFGNAVWSRVPIAALLVFKLRSLRGLANIEVDHPLLSTALGRLPAAAPRIPDPLLERVLARMRQDGFDEAEIAAHYVRQVPGGAS